MGSDLTRRGFLGAAAALVGGVPALAAQSAQSADSASAGRLSHPSVAGRPRTPTSAADNDAAIQAIEKQLRCTCGCTLDVYTCRTTDFSCTYSPELHRDVVALHEEGRTAREILDAFVAKYGEEALMAPEPKGFNLAGYLLPGVVVTGIGATLLWVVSRRRAAVVTEARAPERTVVSASREEMAELERALEEDDR